MNLNDPIDRPSMIEPPISASPIADTDALWDEASQTTPDYDQAPWVPVGYEARKVNNSWVCSPQEGYIRTIAAQSPQVMDKYLSIAGMLFGSRSNHQEASKKVNAEITSLLQTWDAFGLKYAFERNFVYMLRNAAVYEAARLAENLDQLQASAKRLAARGINADENEGYQKTRGYVEQNGLQLYVAMQALTVFPPDATSGRFNPDFMRTATTVCNSRAKTFTEKRLNQQASTQLSNSVNTFELQALENLLSGKVEAKAA